MRTALRRELRHLLLPLAAVHPAQAEQQGRGIHRGAHRENFKRGAGTRAAQGDRDRRRPARFRRGDSGGRSAQPQIFGGNGRDNRMRRDRDRAHGQGRGARRYKHRPLPADRLLAGAGRKRGNALHPSAPQAGGLPQNPFRSRPANAKMGISRRMERIFRQRQERRALRRGGDIFRNKGARHQRPAFPSAHLTPTDGRPYGGAFAKGSYSAASGAPLRLLR